jgi:hypothetical protein
MNIADVPQPDRLVGPDEMAGEWSIGILLLEELFDDKGLQALRARRPLHPAVRLYDILRQLIDDPSSVPQDQHLQMATAVSRLFLDRATWLPDHPKSGFLATAIPDAKSRKMVLSRVADPGQFDDVMAELHCWGWLRKQGWSADLVEEESEPDIRITAPVTTSAEVKRIRVETSTNRVQDVIEKANKQIKRVRPDGAGVLYIYISREEGRAALDDRVPNDVDAHLSRVRRRMASGQCRSVGVVVVMWDDVMIMADRLDLLMVVTRRRSIAVPHSNPRGPVPAELVATRPEASVVLPIAFSGPREVGLKTIRQSDIRFSEPYRQTLEAGSGLDPAHIVEIVREPDAEVVIKGGEGSARFLTRRIQAPASDSLAVVMINDSDDGLDVTAALRIFGPPELLTYLSADPLDAFRRALDDYGIMLKLNGRIAKLFEYERVHGDFRLEGVGGRPEAAIMSAFVKMNDSGLGRWAEVRWAFAVDLDRYRAVLTRNLRP